MFQIKEDRFWWDGF